MPENVMIGLDPEFVLMKDGAPVAAPLAMKSGPHVKEVLTRFGRFFPDNANLELAADPAKTRNEFLGNIRGLMGIAQKAVQGYTMHAIPGLDFPEEQLKHPICQTFACDPDFDAFDLCMNTIDEEAINRPFRSAGGHVHIGHAEGHDYLHDDWGRINTVKNFELMVGTSALLLDNSPDAIRRRTLYGKCSAHRPKEYGVECRSLSNFWLQYPELAGYVYDATQLVAREMLENNLKIKHDILPGIINGARVDEARNVFDEVVDTYPELRAGFESVQDLANADKSIPLHVTWKL